jgi:hypothetical protein
MVILPRVDGTRHAYLGASPSCWSAYGELLAKKYTDPAYMVVHRMTVDAYCAQHPGAPERRTIQSNNVHLAGLYITVEMALFGDFARHIIGSLVADQGGSLVWLPPPSELGEVRVSDVLAASDADAHARAVRRWAEAVWRAWAPHHAHIRELVDPALAK